jgi:hypothetical protein
MRSVSREFSYALFRRLASSLRIIVQPPIVALHCSVKMVILLHL